jgi:hypothetical protein
VTDQISIYRTGPRPALQSHQTSGSSKLSYGLASVYHSSSSASASHSQKLNSAKFSGRMIKAEPWVMAAAALLAPLGYLFSKSVDRNNYSVSSSGASNFSPNQSSSSSQLQQLLQPSVLTPASNILLSLFAAIGYQSSMPLAALGNYFYVLQDLLRMNPVTLHLGNAALAFFPSALIGMAWSADSHKATSDKISSTKSVFGKLCEQIKYTKNYWTKEIPEMLKSSPGKLPQLLKELKAKPFEAVGHADRHFIMFHAMGSLIATGLLLTSIIKNHFQKPEDRVLNPEQEGKFASLGWAIGQLSTLPLIAFTFFNAFNPHIRTKYGHFGKLVPITAIAYGITSILSSVFKPNPHVSVYTDFFKHIASSVFGHLKRRGELIGSQVQSSVVAEI